MVMFDKLQRKQELIEGSTYDFLIDFCRNERVQDVNRNLDKTKHPRPYHEIRGIVESFYGKRIAKRIADINILNLTGCVDPHEDSHFIDHGRMQNKAIFFVLIEQQISEWHPDSLTSIYFFHDGEFDQISQYTKTGSVVAIPFNAADTHALMTEIPVLGFCVWFK